MFKKFLADDRPALCCDYRACLLVQHPRPNVVCGRQVELASARLTHDPGDKRLDLLRRDRARAKEERMGFLAFVLLGIDVERISALDRRSQANMPELRNDPRFPSLCARLGLVDFWLGTDKWPDCASETPYDFRKECQLAAGTTREPFAF